METRLLKYFSILAEELHFGRAAKRLYISQPPLSRQIKGLEEDLGVRLFNRTKRRVQLTPYGRYLQEESHRLFNQIDVMKSHLQLMKQGVSGQVRISYVGDFMYSILPGILSKLRRKYPRIQTVLSELNTESQMASLQAGLVDIGFIRTPAEAQGLSIKRIYEESFSLILPKSHPLSSRRTAPLKAMADEPYVGLSPSCSPSIRNNIISICGKAGFSPKVVHGASQINSIIKLVENDLGYSIVPSGIKQAYRDKVAFFELSDFPERAELLLAYDPKHIDETSMKVVDLVLSQIDRK
jgi:DNA-binding transcriptional LysR family regulator